MELWKKPENKPSVDPANADAPKPEKSAAEQIAEALKPLNDGFASFRTSLDERLAKLEEQTKKPEPKPQPTEGPISVLDDENLAFAQRMTPIFQRTLELESRVVKNDVKNEYIAAGYGDLWAKYQKDIDQVIDSSPLVTAEGRAYRGDPQYIRNVVDMIFGREARKAGMRFDGKDRGFFLESASGGNEAAPSVQADGMNDHQRKLMSRMGIPLEKAKEVMKKLQFVG